MEKKKRTEKMGTEQKGKKREREEEKKRKEICLDVHNIHLLKVIIKPL